MNKLLLITFSALLLGSFQTYAANQPCSGNKGGIDHCEGEKFVCKDGSYSASKKNCSVVFGGGGVTESKTTTPVPTATKAKPEQTKAESQAIPAAAISQSSGKTLELNYPGFTVWLDCAKHGAVKFRYNAQRDSGDAKRFDDFFLDQNVPAECQQTSAKAYGSSYDRGHLVPANHLDSSDAAIKATNTMTNILPQAASMNRGAWLLTEEIVECYRDIDELLVIGGVIWGDNPKDDYFVQSHGVKTPDAFWKVIIRGKGQDERAIAWIVPNFQDATKKVLDKYLVSVDEIERQTGEKIPVAEYAKHDKPKESWLIPKGCNKG